MIKTLIILPAILAMIDPTVPFPVRKHQQLDDCKIVQFIQRKNNEQFVVALPVRASRKVVDHKAIATVYCASSFYCAPCHSLLSKIKRMNLEGSVKVDFSEPSWVPAYPYVVYADSTTDNGKRLVETR